ncbi:MAG: hypothetical protein IT338_17660 [Thermomicrobiales bacterium]|nr:hypothetical protein [Thermomicrobiales bacterium]
MATTKEQLHELRRDLLTRIAPVLDAFIAANAMLDDAFLCEVAVWGLLEAAAITAYTGTEADPRVCQQAIGTWTLETFTALMHAADVHGQLLAAAKKAND